MARKAKCFWEVKVNPVDPAKAGAISLESHINAAHVSGCYHYGAAEWNVTVPYGVDTEIEVRARGGYYNGMGKVVADFTEDLLPERSYRHHRRQIDHIIETLATLGFGTYSIKQVVLLYYPVKFFILLDNGNPEQQIIYRYVNGRSKGTGRGHVLSRTDDITVDQSSVPTIPERTMLKHRIDWYSSELRIMKNYQKSMKESGRKADAEYAELIIDYKGRIADLKSQLKKSDDRLTHPLLDLVS